MLRRNLAIAFWGMLYASPTIALADDYWVYCENYNNRFSRDQMMAACTSIIESRNSETKRGRASAYNNRGLGYYGAEDYVRAIADFDQAIARDPDAAYLYINRGLALRLQGDAARSVADLDRAIQLDPTSFPAYFNRGRAHLLLTDATKALADFDRAVALRPRNYRGHWARGDALMANGAITQAIEAYSTAIRFGEDEPWLLSVRADAYLEVGDFANATRDYDAVALKSPTEPGYQYGRCVARAYGGVELDVARVACDQALQSSPVDAEFLWARGVVGLKQRRYDEAWRDFDASIRVENGATALYGRGLAALGAGRTTDGESDIARAIAQNPHVAADFASIGLRH